MSLGLGIDLIFYSMLRGQLNNQLQIFSSNAYLGCTIPTRL